MNRTAMALCVWLVACGEKVTFTVIVPQMKIGQRDLKLGDQVEGRTGRVWEGKDKLFVTEGEAQPAPSGIIRTPIPVETMYVLAPFTATHADVLAEDRGIKRLEIGTTVSVAKDLPGLNASVLLLVEDGTPKAFLRRADFGSHEPSADDLMRAAKDELVDNELSRVRSFVDAALGKDAKHVGARRLNAALLHAAADPRGWKQWLEVKPEEAPSAHLPQKPAVSAAGEAFAIGEGLSVREKADATAKRLRMIPIGTRVEVIAVAGDWAEVTVATPIATVAVLTDETLVDDVAPWSAAEGASQAPATHGFMAAKFLSTAKPDAAELKTIGLAAKTPQEQLVPLRRALKLQPDAETQSALVKAAVATEQFIFALEALNTKLPDPSKPKATVEITRVLGCRGDRDKARQHVESGSSALMAPAWDEYSVKSEKGSVSLAGYDANVCIIDDEIESVCKPVREISNIDSFLGFGCGEEPTKITKKDEREYDKYVREQTREIAKLESSYAAYGNAYRAWSEKVDKALSGSAMVVRVRANDERPASFVGVYSFTWQVSSWCGEQATGSRQGLTFAKVKLPAMHTGEVLELWIDGVDLERAWGALLFDTDDEMNKYTVSLTEAGSAWQKIPSEYTSVAVESGRGVSECDITRECCAC